MGIVRKVIDVAQEQNWVQDGTLANSKWNVESVRQHVTNFYTLVSIGKVCSYPQNKVEIYATLYKLPNKFIMWHTVKCFGRV